MGCSLRLRHVFVPVVLCVVFLAGAAFATEVETVWNGSVSWQWSIPGNWSNGVPATRLDRAVIPGGTLPNWPEQPAAGNLTLGSLVIQSGAQMTFNGNPVEIYNLYENSGSTSGSLDVVFKSFVLSDTQTITGSSVQTFNSIVCANGSNVSVYPAVQTISISTPNGLQVGESPPGQNAFFRMGTCALNTDVLSVIRGNFTLEGGEANVRNSVVVESNGSMCLDCTLRIGTAGAGGSVAIYGNFFGQNALITSYSSAYRYGFTVYSGGRITLMSSVFEYANSWGLKLDDGAGVIPYAQIDYVAFQNAVGAGCHVYVDGSASSAYSVVWSNCSFEQVPSGGYSVRFIGNSANASNLVVFLPSASGAIGLSNTNAVDANVLWSLGPNSVSQNVPGGTDVASYALISAPGFMSVGELQTQLEAGLGAYNPTMWRLFVWQGDSQQYAELPDCDPAEHFAGGGAFFISRNTAAISLQNGDTTVFPYAEFTLAPGWNMTSNPFPNNDVVWSNVEILSPITGLWVSTGAAGATVLIGQAGTNLYGWADGAYGYETSYLLRNKAYWVKNKLSVALPMRIPRPPNPPPKPGLGGVAPSFAPIPAGEEQPPGPPAFESSSGSGGGGGGGGGGGCFVGNAARTASVPEAGLPSLLICILALAGYCALKW